MTPETALARIADNPKLPTPPALTLQVIERANSPDCSIAEIGSLISHDPAMCGKMLKLVNSSLYGLHHPVTSIDRALNLLGLNHVRSLVLSLSLPSMRLQNASGEQVKDYWKCSVTLAIVCHELATRMKWPDPDSELVAGLLCDFGMLLLHETFPKQMSALAVLPLEERLQRQCEFEVERVGVDHAEAGAYVLNRWRLAADVTEPIRFHHRPEAAPPAHAKRAQMLYFATRIEQVRQAPDHGDALGAILALARERYRMDAKAFMTFLESLNDKIDEFAALLDIDFGPREGFADLVARSTENLTRLAIEASLDNVRVQEEKSQLERRLLDAREALRVSEQNLMQAQKLEAIGRLAGGVAHDFNNLLSIILSSCDLLFDVPTLDEDARELVDMIKQSGGRAANLTRQLLAFGRKQRFAAEVISLNATIVNMTKLLSSLLGENVRLATKLSDDLAPVKADPTQIEQVILNLAVNARDAMAGGGSLVIETFNLQLDSDLAVQNPEVVPGRYTVIAVRDTGHGIEAAHLPQIFEPFFTTKEHGKGTGLGLATVHGIVRQSGGYITVRSVPGQGSVFHVYLPIASETLVESTPEIATHGSAHGSGTILIVEDEDGLRELTRRVLATHGYTVLAARHGAEALALFDRYADSIRLVVTDTTMPGMSGPHLISELARRRPGLKAILVSGFANQGDSATEKLSTATPYLQKPFTAQQLISLVQEVLMNRKQRHRVECEVGA